MATITAAIKESNARTNGAAFINAVEVTSSLTIQGSSDAQTKFAKSVLDNALAELVKGFLKAKGLDGYCDGAALDSAVAEINAQLQQFAEMLDGAQARKILDNKGSAPSTLIQAAMAR